MHSVSVPKREMSEIVHDSLYLGECRSQPTADGTATLPLPYTCDQYKKKTNSVNDGIVYQCIAQRRCHKDNKPLQADMIMMILKKIFYLTTFSVIYIMLWHDSY